MTHEKEILDLISSSAGKAAPYITEKLRLIGDGQMSAGITALTKYKYNKKADLKNGFGLGVLSTLIAVGIVKISFDFYRKKTKESNEIQQANQNLETEAIETESSEQPVYSKTNYLIKED